MSSYIDTIVGILPYLTVEELEEVQTKSLDIWEQKFKENVEKSCNCYKCKFNRAARAGEFV